MQIKFLDLPVKKDLSKVVLGIGYFDGVHLGHQLLVDKVLELSKKEGLIPAIFTFDNNLHTVLGNKYQDGSLTPLDDKLQIFADKGIEICYILRFNREIANLSYQEFKKQVLDQLNIQEMVCGTDFRFGYKGEGSLKELKEFFSVSPVELLEMEGNKVSSTLIQKLLVAGNIEDANKLLGRPYTIKGKVIKGHELGKKLGFPTANIEPFYYVIPKNGVYKVKVLVSDQEYYGVANIGVHPTVGALDKRIVEVHILDFEQEIYDQTIAIKFERFIRDEMKFSSVEDLKKQINLDTFSNF